MRAGRAVVWGIALAFAVGCGGARSARRPAVPPEDRLGRALAAVRSAGGFAGAVAAIATDATVTTAAVGWADREARVPMRPGDRMPVGGAAKPFTAALVLALAADGTLDLDAPVARWLRDEPWFARVPNADALTLRLLLMHRAGLPNHATALEFVRTVQAQTASAARPASRPDPSPRGLVALVLDQPPLFAPGAGFAYSDTGFVIAGLVVEKATGRPEPELLTERVLAPLALDATTPATGRAHPGLVPGYATSEGPLGLEAKTAALGVLAFEPEWEGAGGGLVSNARDLARFAKALFEGRALPPGAIDDLLASRLPGDVRYGLGVRFYGDGTARAYGHSGWFPGYRTEVRYYPARRAAIAIQVNGDEPFDADAAFEKLLGAVPETGAR